MRKASARPRRVRNKAYNSRSGYDGQAASTGRKRVPFAVRRRSLGTARRTFKESSDDVEPPPQRANECWIRLDPLAQQRALEVGDQLSPEGGIFRRATHEVVEAAPDEG